MFNNKTNIKDYQTVNKNDKQMYEYYNNKKVA